MRTRITSKLALGAAVVGVFASVLVPAAAFAANQTAGTTINATIGSTISISTSGTVTLAITPTASGSATSASDTVSVSTNNSTGYNLTLASSSAQVTLTNGGNSIAASSGTQASPVTLANNTWGYRVDSAGGFGSGPTSAQSNVTSLSNTWAGIPASGSPNTLKTTATTAAADTTVVWYGAKVDTTKPNGTYSNTVTYTATTNP